MKRVIRSFLQGIAFMVCVAALAGVAFFAYADAYIREIGEHADFLDSRVVRERLQEYIRPEAEEILSRSSHYTAHDAPYDLEISLQNDKMNAIYFLEYHYGETVYVYNPYYANKNDWIQLTFPMELNVNYEKTWDLGRTTYTGPVKDVLQAEVTLKFHPRSFDLQNQAYAILLQGHAYSRLGIPVGMILALLLFVILAMRTGYDAQTRRTVLRISDRIPIEIWLTALTLCCWELYRLHQQFTLSLWELFGESEGREMGLMTAALAAALVVTVGVLLQCLLTVIVRLRGGADGKETSLIVRAFLWVTDVFLRFAKLPRMLAVSAVVLAWFGFVGYRIAVTGRISWILILAASVLIFAVGYIHTGWQMQRIVDQTRSIARGERPKTDPKGLFGSFRTMNTLLDQVDEGLQIQVEERMKSERMRSELITNVSHDIKTPLTSFISYVNLIEKEESLSPKVQEYTAILARHAARLKKMTDDLFEMSKAASGTLTVRREVIDLAELVLQAMGDYGERLETEQLTPVVRLGVQEARIEADGTILNRVMSNLLGNIIKYAMPGTRVYVDLNRVEEHYTLTVRNISASPLDRSTDELLERFTRGDNARSSEGSGLGLYIAKQLTELNDGTFALKVDGDLFRVDLKFPAVQDQQEQEA